MFLNELNKNQATAFINLVNQFANVDQVFAKEEKELIDDYIKELNIDKEVVNSMSFEEIVDELKVANNRTKLIVYFELVGLALVDGDYGDKEIDFLDEIAISLDIRRDKKIAFANYFFNFKDVYNFSVVEAESKIKLLKEEAELLLA
ncbi:MULTISPECIES: hypothetical protein [Clostridium]|uniref:Tellurite resistance protein TerB n=1 Tax=Clostridium cibarium TaxID=2762247 RepID=A0ABR8PNP5_9CLOT|nr:MULTISPECIES: hypothetical protein [Clostridium]MBD7909800.1 hypothetical protein [Clostridium cibarium]